MGKKDDYQPVYIMPEGTQRSSGKSAQRMNIMAARLVAEAVRTTLGPKGMDKMLVDSVGEVTVTNDGVTILKEIEIDHPTAKMIVEIAKTQEEEVGDGTTTAVIIAGELLRKAEELLDKNIHPTLIAKGYRLAEHKAQEILRKMGAKLDPSKKKEHDELLRKIGETAMTGKGAEEDKEKLSGIVLEAVNKVGVMKNGSFTIDKADIKIEKKPGASVEESELIQGIVLDKEKVHSSMPATVKNAKIALIDTPLEVRSPETDTKISITDPEKIQSFLDMEESMVKRMIDKVASTGANVVFCQKGIDDLAQHFLAKKGVYALRRIKKSDMEKLSKATNANIISDLNDFSSEDLGTAGIVEEVKVGEEFMTYVRECENPRALTILLRGATMHTVDEVKRAVEDAIGDIVSALKGGLVVAGAGASEIELSKEIGKYAHTLSGREQLAVSGFAEALEVIPKTLAENAGLDPIDMLAELKAAHDEGKKWAGINVFTGKIIDAWREGVIEPLKIKTHAVSSATEVAVMILRIDDVILAGKNEGHMSAGKSESFEHD